MTVSVVIINKDEEALDSTLVEVAKQIRSLEEPGEIVVVDASEGRLDSIRMRHENSVRWLDYKSPVGTRVTIPHQRNVGVRAAKGDIIVFIDAGCRPCDNWLKSLISVLEQDEDIVAGIAQGLSGEVAFAPASESDDHPYLRECATINLAFKRSVFDAIGGFDESFAYGSDVDFTWRLNDAGYRIRCAKEAVVRHDYGSRRRQRRRSYVYGKARARLYRKHRGRIRSILRYDPMVVVYPLFLLGLPLTLFFPLYPFLLLIPAWRNRSQGGFRVLIDHLWYGAGVLVELVGQ